MNPGSNHCPAIGFLKVTTALFLALYPILGVSNASTNRIPSLPIAARPSPIPEHLLLFPTPSPSPPPQPASLPVYPSPGLRLAADFTFVQSADTGIEGSTDVYNGDQVTYTIVLHNQSSIPLANILIKDRLPSNTLDRIVCTEDCELVVEENIVPEPTGGTIIVTATREISWSFPSLASSVSITVEFSGRVRGQPEGSNFTNYVFVTALRDGIPVFASGNEPLDLTAHVRIQAGGGASISEVPTWFSQDIGGTIDQDWGDFDRDGDLDLALGSSLGASVYRNESGRLTRIQISPPDGQSDQRLSYGVRWADVDQDPQQRLELIVVGDSEDRSATSHGLNYVYSYDQGIEEFVQLSTFTSWSQLVRLAPSDYDGDGDVDIAASSNAIDMPDPFCPLVLYRNDGTGHFTGTVIISDTHFAASSPDVECLGDEATAALGPGDYDRDGDMDLAIGVFPTTIQLLVNGRNGQVITQDNPFTSPINIETTLEYLPYDLAWGDYDQDGYLDLAAAYPIQREARIYRNQLGDGLEGFDPIAQSLRTAPFMTPLSIEWGDFNGDGRLELAVADSPPRIYQYVAVEDKFVWIDTLALPPSGGQVWSARAVDLNGNRNLDLVVSNRDGPSQLFTTLAPKLKPTITPVGTRKAGSVAWGDYDHDLDADLDLLLGCSDPPDVSSFLHVNDDGDFATKMEFTPSGFGPHIVAFGDATGNGQLDVAIGTPNKVQVYHDGAVDPAAWSVTTEDPVHSLAWGDANDDERLDLLVGEQDGTINLYLNLGTQLSATPTITITAPGDVRSLAWGDFDGDYYLDFAVGIYDGPMQIYRSNGGPLQPDQPWSFSLAWTAPFDQPTRALAWADYDSDGDLDLAVGNDGVDDCLWENDGGAFSTSPVWSSNTPSKTTSLAWGDWDNDGYLDLAAGHEGEPDVVYANVRSTQGSPQLFVLWMSAESYATTGVAWGDRDGDGDLDLAISQAGSGGQNGFYENTLVAPAHLPDSAAEATALPNPSSYLYVERPGDTRDAYFYSSPPVLAKPPGQQTVTVRYEVYDPEERPIAATYFEYSLDGGSQWQPATQAVGSPAPITQTLNTGQEGVFVWDAAADDAISDDARFRFRVVHQHPVGPVQHASSSAVSPPFRVRAVDCIWPADVSIAVTPEHPDPGQIVTFNSYVASPGGPGSLSYHWDFGDGATSTSKDTTHTYCCHSDPAVILRVTGSACPVARPAYAKVQMVVGLGGPDIYLPLVLKSYMASAVNTLVDEETVGLENRETGKLGSGSSPPIHQPTNLPIYQSTNLPIYQPTNLPAHQSANLPSNVTRITSYKLGANSRPTISEDGARVAFWTTGRLTGQNDDGNVEVFLAEVHSDGSVAYTQITSSTGTILGGFNFGPIIDDAGQRIAFFSDLDPVGLNPDRSFEIFLAEVGSTIAITQVTQTPRGFSVLPDLSGDGRFIAFVSNNDIYRAEVVHAPIVTPTWYITHTRVTTITEENGSGDQPTINEDGRFIAFISDQDFAGGNADGNREVILAEIASNGAVTYTQVTVSEGGINDQPSISADGSRIAFLSDRDLVAGQNPGGVRQIFVAKLITATRSFTITQITTDANDKDYPSISADATRVAYVSTNDRRLHLYDLVEEKEKVEDMSGGKAYPVISANGTDIVYVSDWNIFRASYPLADLSIAKSADRDEVGAGEEFNYTIVVANNGPSPATDVRLTDDLPYGVQAILPPTPDNVDATFADFDAGTDHGTGWDSSNGWLYLSATGNPFELPPNDSGIDFWANMQDNALLLHLNSGPPSYPDMSGNGVSVSCFSLLNWCPSLAAGKMGAGAQKFDGFDDYLDASTHTAISYLGPATWMMWVRRDSDNPGTLMYKNDDGSYTRWWIESSAGELRFYGGRPPLDIWRYTRDIPELGEWFHLTVTWDGSIDYGGIRIYINGQEAYYSVSGSGFLPGSASSSLRIGRGGDVEANAFFDGALDEIAIYRRVLSAEEVQTIYSRQSSTRAAYFDSRTMTETTGSGAWSSIAWLPQRVVGRELPDEGGVETGYPTGTVGMTGTVLLLHLNEPGGASAFLDTSGSGNDAYCYEDRCPMAGLSGRFKRALRFDGWDDYAEVPHSDSLNVADELTMAAWVKLSSSPNHYYQAIVGKSTYGNGYTLYVANNQLYPLIWDSAGAFYGTRWGTIPTGVWTHLAATWRTDGEMIGYINGEKVGDISVGSNPIGANSNPLRIGVDPWYAMYDNIKGLVDEVAIFNRALEPDEIRSHYLRGVLRMSFQVRTCPEPETNCTSFVGPDGTQGTTYSDLSNPELFPPEFLLDVVNNPYLQYRLYMDSYTAADTPQLKRVEVKPRAECKQVEYNSQRVVTCTLGSYVAPLLPSNSIAITLSVSVTDSAYFSATFVNNHLSIVNTAQINAWESDHYLGDNEDSVPTKLESIPLDSVTISGSSTGQLGSPYSFDAVASPTTALPPVVQYTWQATDFTTTVIHTAGFTDVVDFTWDMAGAKTVTVEATNDGETVVSDTHTINIQNPMPVLDSISPTTATAGGPSFTLTVNGSNFVNGSIVRWNGFDRTTGFVSSTQLTATIPAGNIATAGAASVIVFNPAGGGPSNVITFTIENPVPVLSSISPVTATAGGPTFTLTANGSSFVNDSIVRWNGSGRTTSFVSSTKLTATIPASDIATTGTVTVTVFNPGPGGGTSLPQVFTITLTMLASNSRRGFVVATAWPEDAAKIMTPDVTAVALRPRSRVCWPKTNIRSRIGDRYHLYWCTNTVRIPVLYTLNGRDLAFSNVLCRLC